MPRLLIRAMTARDVAKVCALDRLCIPTPWAEETFLAELGSPVARYRVAEQEGEIVGYAGAHVILDEAHVTTLGVHPERRRQRIGERLLADSLRAALDAGCRRVTLEVRASNAAAQGLYRKYGFAPVSRRRGYYTDNDEDAIVMWIEDTSRLGFRDLLAERLAELESGREDAEME